MRASPFSIRAKNPKRLAAWKLNMIRFFKRISFSSGLPDCRRWSHVKLLVCVSRRCRKDIHLDFPALARLRVPPVDDRRVMALASILAVAQTSVENSLQQLINTRTHRLENQRIHGFWMVYLPIDYLPKKSQRTIHVGKYTSPNGCLVSFWGNFRPIFMDELFPFAECDRWNNHVRFLKGVTERDGGMDLEVEVYSYQPNVAGDGRNPASVDMANINLSHILTGFHTCQVVQDFFHQQYPPQPGNKAY